MRSSLNLQNKEAVETCSCCCTSAGCSKHGRFTCQSCGKLTRWSDGAADDRPNDCSGCWRVWFEEGAVV
jgi:hypothetical protein